MAGESSEMIGLHQHATAVFQRFRWVFPGRLARSSAPHYVNNDSDQNMDSEAVDFLVSQGVTNIISFNGHRLSEEEIHHLHHRKISYHHIALPDYTAPTLDQLELLHFYFTNGGVALIYCGFGHGRTGTAISALQLYDNPDIDDSNFRDNHVETPEQMKVLNDLKDKLKR